MFLGSTPLKNPNKLNWIQRQRPLRDIWLNDQNKRENTKENDFLLVETG